MRAGLLALTVILAGCTRLGFSRSDAAADAGSSGADRLGAERARGEAGRADIIVDAPACKLGAWSKPVRIVEVSAYADDDWYPAISPDGLSLIFHSWRPGLGAADLWQASRKSPAAAFSTPVNLTALNSGQADERPTFGPDGRTLYFSSSRTADDDIRVSTLDSAGKWSTPVLLNAPAYPGYDEVGAVSSDGNTLFVTGWVEPTLSIFTRTRASASAPFGPMELVPEVSSPDNEEVGALSRNGLELYLCSVRAGGKGKLDVWVARRSSPTGQFTPPVNVSELNTIQDELVGSISADGRTLYLTVGANVKGGLDADIFYSTRACLP